MDIVSGILGSIGVLGSLFGGNSAQREANRLKERQMALQERGLANYERQTGYANQYRIDGLDYLRKQGGAYNQLGQYGTTDRTNAMSLLNQYLPQYAKVSGLPVAGGGMPGLNFPGGNGYAQPTTGPLSIDRGEWQKPFNENIVSGPFNPNEAKPSTMGEYQTGLTTSERDGMAARADQSTDPYGLSLPQQEQLNQRVDAIRVQEESAIQEYRAALAQQGLPPNPAGESRIRQQLSGMAQQEKSNFAENARAERAKALQNLISLATNEKQSGNALLSEQAGGYGNVAAGYGNFANSAVGQAEGGPYQQIANQYAQQSQFNTQRADDMYQSLGQLLPLIGEFFKSGKKKETSTGDWGGEAG